jgi:hypothetical protein
MQDATVQSDPDVGEREGTVLEEQMCNWELTGTLAKPLM